MIPAHGATPPHPYPWNQPHCPCDRTLHVGTPAQAGLVPEALTDIDGIVSRLLTRRAAPGAVVLVARRGVIAKWKAYGYALLYKNADYDRVGHPLPMQKDEIFDMASVSKLFTATAVMQLWDEGKFKLDDPVAKYLPEFGVNGKGNVTIRQLLTHTSGFRPDPATPLYKVKGSRADRLDFVLQLPLAHPPGTHYVYSDINFLVLGALIEHLSGEREDVFIREHLTAPLHMRDTMYDPPARLKPRIAASEYQPWTGRGLLWGQVDDENAWALDGVAGHAGIFSSAHDLAVFGQMMLNGGTYDGVRVLSEQAVKLLLTNWNQQFPDDATGLGWSIDRGYLMGALSGPETAGHEGFTGTMIAINPNNDIVAILLTNRVHPTRHGASIVTAIRQVFTGIANAIPVNAPQGGKAWFSGYGDYLNRTLTARVKPQDGAMLSFKTWYRLAPGNDFGSVEASSDGVHWKELDLLTGYSNGWQSKRVALPADTRYIQFRYRTDSRTNGRGWYVDALRVGVDGSMVSPEVTDSEWHKRDD
ncbi:MAG TPA: serine hydrolase [Oleiagrimonas sp.]|nr:serine hydrolase [Oleiagrimonas sp.]